MIHSCAGMETLVYFFQAIYITALLRNTDAELFRLDIDGTELWELRFVDGTTPFDGKPEVYLNEKFHPICDEYITPNVAKVICRQLRLPPMNASMKAGDFADNKDSFLRCDGDEEWLMQDCNWAVFPKDEECFSNEGIVCNGNIRLVDGENRTQGNVQIYREGELTSICDYKPDRKTAQIICAQLGYETEKAVLYTGSYFGSGLNGTHYIECTGDESTHEDCQYIRASKGENCGDENNLGVDCLGRKAYVFLYGARFSDEKLLDYLRIDVEIDYYIGYWCDDVDGATNDELEAITNIASVICHEAGYSRYRPSVSSIPYGTWYESNEYILSIKDLICTGKETSLSQCIRRGSFLNGGDCHADEVVIRCNDLIQLADGDRLSNGRVEFKEDQNGTWRALQVLGPDPVLAKVLCFQLGYESSIVSALRLRNFYGESQYEPWPYIYTCAGTEKSVGQCQKRPLSDNETSYINVGVECVVQSVRISTEFDDFRNEILTLKRGNNLMYACAEKNATIDYFTSGVLCHSLGFSVFESSYTLVPFDGNVTSVTDMVTRAKCRGIESELAQCALVKENSATSSCDMAISLKCADQSCAVPPLQVKKTIKCYSQFCENVRCSPENYQECSFENGEACGLEKTYEKFGQQFILMRRTQFCGQCKGEYTKDDSARRSRQCCYQDYCNTESAEVRNTQRVMIEKSTMPFEGQIKVLYQGQWKAIHVDQRPIPQSFLRHVCYEVGYLNSTIAIIHGTPNADLGQTAINVVDYKNCTTLGTPSCPVNDVIIGSPTLTLNCNARSPLMRLVDGLSKNAGRLELFYNNTWSTVCNKDFTDGSANLVCRTLGYSSGCSASNSIQPNIADFRTGKNKVLFSKLSCQGNEQNIWLCDHRFSKYQDRGCSHEDDVGIVCDDAQYPYEVAEKVPILTSQEQTTIIGPEHPTTEKNVIQHKDMMCREGVCASKGCNSSETITYCNITDGGECYTEQQRRFISGQIIFNFGCTKICNKGMRKGVGVEITTFCCSKSLCNDVTNVEEVQLFQDGNMTDVIINVGNHFQISLITFLLTFLMILKSIVSFL